jgi:hypothetical protein
MKMLLFPALLLLATLPALQAQRNSGPRLFLDLPAIYFVAPDVEHVGNLLGAGAEAAFNVGTHWSVARIGGGTTVTMDPKSEDIGATIATRPYGLLEGGLGIYRSNGNQCAKSHQSAYTAMAKAGLRYTFNQPEAVEALDYTLGVELGFFYIRDMFRNIELLAQANYMTRAKVVSANFGFRFFFNLRANR